MQKFKKYIQPVNYTILLLLCMALTIHYRTNFTDDFPNDIFFCYYTLGCGICGICLAWLTKTCHVKYQKLLHGFLFFLIPLLMTIYVELLNGNMLWDIDLVENVLMNYLINLLFCMAFFVLTGSYRVGYKLSECMLLVFGIANMYVKMYKGSPLLPWDLTAIRTATAVAGAFSYEINAKLLMAVMVFLITWITTDFFSKIHHTKLYYGVRIGCGILFSGICIFYYGTDYFAKDFGATPDFFNQTRGYESKGAIAEFIVNTKYLSLNKPAGYDVENLDTEIEEYTQKNVPTILETDYRHDGKNDTEIQASLTASSVNHPNIIVIMNEAFSDLSVIGDFQTNQDYMPFINSLKDTENVISGNSYVSTIGTGTSNTEYEFLTGNTMGFLPVGSNAYQLYVNHTQPGLVSSLIDSGYSAQAFHPYYKKNWNRVSVYENMGFEKFTGIEEMDYFHKLRLFVSDETDFQYIENMYQERDPNIPFFLFNITMQNHSSYDQNANFYQQIHLENTLQEYPLAEQYLSLIKETDDQFANLISYFNQIKEPTIILMYGDHQPFIEDAFYEEVMGKSLNDLTDEEQQLRYITRFVMWANYDIPEDWIDQISVNYLSTLLCQVAGIETTPYQDFLSSLYQEYPVVSLMGCRNWKNQWYAIDDALHQDQQLQVYSHLAYNNLIEDEKRRNALFHIKSQR